MSRILKRDYNTRELLEIGLLMIDKANEDQKGCYDNVSRTKNSIEMAYHRQMVRSFKLRLKQEEKDNPSGLF